MELTLGFSPCPNDTFIFDALVNGQMDTGGIRFKPVLEDVETLNQWLEEGRLDITKLSFPAFFRNVNRYVLLRSGGAMGIGVGPLLISADPGPLDTSAVNRMTTALPGAGTTANLLFSFAYPEALHKEYMVFSAIEDAVQNHTTGLGVIIHENRFTYRQKGLHKITDLGEFWEQKMHCPVPLGGIAIRRSMAKELAYRVEELIRQSLARSWASYPQLSGFVKAHAQAMSEEVMRKHIDLYVNEFTRDAGEEGRRAISTLYEVFNKLNPGLPPGAEPLFSEGR